MKIVYTPEEAAQILQDNQPNPACKIEIETPYRATPDFPIHSVLIEARRFNFKGNEKIAAIKAIRTIATNAGFNITLCDAKNFVEAL